MILHWCQNDPNMMPALFSNDAEIILNHAGMISKMILKWCENDDKGCEYYFEMTPQWF